MANSKPKESIRALLSEIVDYAGLFPPSALSMPEAVINYATYKNSNYNWMLGRFVVAVNRLDEFLETAKDFFARDKTGVWRLSVLANDDFYETIRKIEDFNAENAPNAVCDSIEIKANTNSLIKKIAEAVPPNFMTYVEIPNGENLAEFVSTLAIKKLRGKIRLGGVVKESFPRIDEISRFMKTCLAANVPFKATAGLHHPVRCFKPLTYEENAPTGTMNGFLNVFLAAGFIRQGFKMSVIHELLEDEVAEDFVFDQGGILWRQEFLLTNWEIKKLRETGITSFGSCSFEEPIEDLQDINLL